MQKYAVPNATMKVVWLKLDQKLQYCKSKGLDDEIFLLHGLLFLV